MVLFQGCGPKIYVNPEFSNIKDSHHTVAILPFKVNYDAGKLPKDMDEAGLTQMSREDRPRSSKSYIPDFWNGRPKVNTL